jgi:serine/threonine protein kinase
MRLYAWDGDRAAAMNQYQKCSDVLIEELGVEPALETQSLYNRIISGEPIQEEFSIRGYELDECIGEGNFGVVYLARQLQTDRQVAIKVIRPIFANQVDFIRRFEKEALLVARLEHPHIVPLYDFWREPNGAFLVMRWLRAGSLQAALKFGAWETETSIKLVRQITGALAYAHGRGVVHRDIKPANILLDEDGNAYYPTSESLRILRTCRALPPHIERPVRLSMPLPNSSLVRVLLHERTFTVWGW